MEKAEKKRKMKKIYLVHGWGGNPDSEAWFPWLKAELKGRNIKLDVLEMPNPEQPKIEEWVAVLEKKAKGLDEETYFIGHSIGCQAILRFLEKLPDKIRIRGCVFVAGWFNLKESAYEEEEEKEIAKPWINSPIDLKKVKKHAKSFLAIFSEDDECVPLSDSKTFKEKLNAEIIIKKNEGHFNETKEIKEVIDFIER